MRLIARLIGWILRPEPADREIRRHAAALREKQRRHVSEMAKLVKGPDGRWTMRRPIAK